MRYDLDVFFLLSHLLFCLFICRIFRNIHSPVMSLVIYLEFVSRRDYIFQDTLISYIITKLVFYEM